MPRILKLEHLSTLHANWIFKLLDPRHVASVEVTVPFKGPHQRATAETLQTDAFGAQPAR